jgi:TRAP-type mannitol/chloroaromatic compound transport system permease small subunit
MPGKMPAPSAAIDRISAVTGQAAAWLTLLMVVVTFVIVVMRYVFGSGLI